MTINITRSVVGNLHEGAEMQLLDITVSEAREYAADFSIQSDAVLVTLIATSVASSLDVLVTAVDEPSGLESSPLLAFPTVTGPASNLLIQRSGIVPANLRLRVTAGVGGASFRVKVRAVSSGTSDTRILGADSLKVSQVTVGTSAQVLIAASLLDRAGIVIKNWSSTQTVYLAESLVKATSSVGYPLAPRDAIAMDVSAGVSIYVISDSPNADIRIAESGG